MVGKGFDCESGFPYRESEDLSRRLSAAQTRDLLKALVGRAESGKVIEGD